LNKPETGKTLPSYTRRTGNNWMYCSAVADLAGTGGRPPPPIFFWGGDAPPKILKKNKNTLDLIGFQLKKKYTLALLFFFIKFAPLKKILDPPLLFGHQNCTSENLFVQPGT
jgi:hypothetical protein